MPERIPKLTTKSIRGVNVGFGISIRWIPHPLIVAKELEQLAFYYERMQPALAASAAIARSDIIERFETETDPGGEEWEEWAESYAEYAEAHNTGILQQTGDLRSEATSMGRFVIAGHTLSYAGGNLPHYGMAHQTGSSRETRSHAVARQLQKLGFGTPGDEAGLGKNYLPARPFIGMSDEAQLEVLEVWDAWFVGGIISFLHHKGGTIQPIVRTSRGPRFGPKVGMGITESIDEMD